MESINSGLHQQIPTTYRSLQPQAEQALTQAHLTHHHTLGSQPGLDLSGLVQDNDNSVYPELGSIQDHNTGHSVVHQYPSPIPFERNGHHQGMQHVAHSGSPTPHHQHPGQGQFGILTGAPTLHHNGMGRLHTELHQETDLFGTPNVDGDQKATGHQSFKIVPKPPNLEAWREKLFNVDEIITLSEEEYVHQDRKFNIQLENEKSTNFCVGTILISRMSIMFTHIDLLKNTSASHLFLTIGTVALKADHPEQLNLMIPTRKKEREPLESAIFAMLKSKSQSISQARCCVLIFSRMEVS